MLDMTRGLAIFMVVSFHYFPNKVTTIGWTGVNLFFVLSGYLIGGILIDNRTSDRRPRPAALALCALRAEPQLDL